MLPEIRAAQRIYRGHKRDVFITGKQICFSDSKRGQELLDNMKRREDLLRALSKYEGLWHSAFRGEPPADIEPRKITRSFLNNNNKPVILNSEFFDSLKNDADPYYRNTKTFYYNDTYYRSAAEVDIARYYTEHDIPFKYEPEIWLKGMKYPYYSDFVFLIRELDLCKFHEHFGMKNFANYAIKTQTKLSNYSEAGLVPDFDVICTYDFDSIPFDLRMLETKINHAVYDSLFAADIPS